MVIFMFCANIPATIIRRRSDVHLRHVLADVPVRYRPGTTSRERCFVLACVVDDAIVMLETSHATSKWGRAPWRRRSMVEGEVSSPSFDDDLARRRFIRYSSWAGFGRLLPSSQSHHRAVLISGSSRSRCADDGSASSIRGPISSTARLFSGERERVRCGTERVRDTPLKWALRRQVTMGVFLASSLPQDGST